MNNSGDGTFGVVVLVVLLILVIVTVVKSVRKVPQQQEFIVERFGKYKKTMSPGINFLVPYLDSVRAKVDKREQVVSFPPQPVITSDNLVVSIDTVIYYVVVNSGAATYAIADYLQGVEQLTVTTLRNVVGSIDLEKALTSRDMINSALRGVLDEATGRWGIKVTRVEIKAIDPPPSVRESMEKQMRADRDRRAAILTAEGVKASQVLTAEGEQQAAVLRAQGERQARILQAEGQSKAIETVFSAIHRSNPDEKLLAYQYLQMLPQIAAGQSNKVWVVPAELTRALDAFGGAMGGLAGSLGGQTASPSAGDSGDDAKEPVSDSDSGAHDISVPDVPAPEVDAPEVAVKPVTVDPDAIRAAVEGAPHVSPSQYTISDAAREVLGEPLPGTGDDTPTDEPPHKA